MTATFNEQSSFTADGIAYRRIFTDIPLSGEIWDILTDIRGKPPPDELERMKNRDLLPFFEARYRLTDRELKKVGVQQVLELAPGLSSRGMIMTKSPNMIYVEIDLPGKMDTKQKVLTELLRRKQIEFRPNLFFEKGNVINTDDFRHALRHFNDKEPVVVICEGLLRYVSFPDKEILGRNIFNLIKQSGGMWITPDIEFSNDIVNLSPERRASYDQIARTTGFGVTPNLFRDEVHAQYFFEGLGFTVTKYRLDEIVDQLVCPRRLGISDEAVAAALRNRWIYVMQ